MKGSHDTYGGWEPRTCCLCGQPIVKSRQNVRFSLSDQHGVRSWHTDCEQPGRGWPGQPSNQP